MSSVVGNVLSSAGQYVSPLTVCAGVDLFAIAATALVVNHCMKSMVAIALQVCFFVCGDSEGSEEYLAASRGLPIIQARPVQEQVAAGIASADKHLTQFLNNAPADIPGMRLRSGKIKPLAV